MDYANEETGTPQYVPYGSGAVRGRQEHVFPAGHKNPASSKVHWGSGTGKDPMRNTGKDRMRKGKRNTSLSLPQLHHAAPRGFGRAMSGRLSRHAGPYPHESFGAKTAFGCVHKKLTHRPLPAVTQALPSNLTLWRRFARASRWLLLLVGALTVTICF